VPFDEHSAVIPNEGGRVLDAADGAPVPGEYVVGWIKRGPSGVIGTNKKDAQETVDAMLADLRSPRSSNGDAPSAAHDSVHRPGTPDAAAVETLLRSRQPELVTYTGWQAIDRHERALGEPAGRPRVKLTTIEELLRAAAAEDP
jgi:ferredoxin/flavodoxin---NADP+ reductase